MLVVSLAGWSLPARLPMEETTPCHGMMPTWSGASNPGRAKGMHMEEERGRGEMIALKYEMRRLRRYL